MDEDEYIEGKENYAENVWRMENGYGLNQYWFEGLLLRELENDASKNR